MSPEWLRGKRRSRRWPWRTPSALLPSDAPASAKLDANLSFGLAGLADNIVARTPDGGETMVIDLSRALGESDAESLDARIARLSRLIAGAAFRQAWGNYRANSPAWKQPEPELGPYEPLMRIVAEAGPVALFAVDESFFPLSTWLKGMQKKAFYDLERAATNIAESETELDKRVEVMSELRRADFARRVVAPVGMFLADGIRAAAGPDALKAALAGGPHAFFVAYDHASQKNKDLPAAVEAHQGEALCRRETGSEVVSRDLPLRIAGRGITTGPWFEVRSPHSGELLARVAKAGPEQVESALAAAVLGFDESRRLPGHRRADVLRSIRRPSKRAAPRSSRRSSPKPASPCALPRRSSIGA